MINSGIEKLCLGHHGLKAWLIFPPSHYHKILQLLLFQPTTPHLILSSTRYYNHKLSLCPNDPMPSMPPRPDQCHPSLRSKKQEYKPHAMQSLIFVYSHHLSALETKPGQCHDHPPMQKIEKGQKSVCGGLGEFLKNQRPEQSSALLKRITVSCPSWEEKKKCHPAIHMIHAWEREKTTASKRHGPHRMQ